MNATLNPCALLNDGTITTVYSDETGWCRTWTGPSAEANASHYASPSFFPRSDYTVTLFITSPDRAQVIATKRRAAA